MPHAAGPIARPTTTIETSTVPPYTESAAELAATHLIERLAPSLAKALVENGGKLDLHFHLKSRARKSGGQVDNPYRIRAAIYE